MLQPTVPFGVRGHSLILSPGQRLRSLIDELELDQNKFADKLAVTRQTINYLVNDRQSISREMANRLARLSGHTPGYWLQSEFAEDASSALPARGATVLVDEQIISAVASGLIGIDPFDSSQVQAASIDLTLGEDIIAAGGNAQRLRAGQSFELLPGRTALVSTRETLRLPNNHLGRVGAITKIARFGIIAAHGLQVDPSYQGRLMFCLFNAGVRSYRLAYGEPIISLELTRLAVPHSRGRIATQHNAADVEENFTPARACLEIVRRWLESRTEVEAVDGRVAATIAGLGVEVIGANEKAAFESAVSTALTTFHKSCDNPKLAAVAASYRDFFAAHAGQLYLNHDEAHRVALMLGLQVESGVILLRSEGFLPLPQGPGEVALASIAERLNTPVDEIILALTRSIPGRTDETTAAVRAITPGARTA